MFRIPLRFCAVLLGSAALMMPPAMAHEIGLQLYSVRNQLAEDLPATFKAINDWGIRVVEGGGALYEHPVAEFRQQLEMNNIELVSADTNYEELRDNPIAAVYKANYFGARYATFYWIPHDGDTGFTFEQAREAVDVMNTAGKLLRENGITLQYHAHGYEFSAHEDGTIMDYILANVTEATFQMDVFWFKQGSQDPTEWLQRYPGRFTSLHLKDRLPGTADSTDGKADVETNVVLGEGDVGIADVVREARKQGIRYFFIEDESSRVMQQVPLSKEFLHSLEKY